MFVLLFSIFFVVPVEASYPFTKYTEAINILNMNNRTYVQNVFVISGSDGLYRDAIVLIPAEYDLLSITDLEKLTGERYANWQRIIHPTPTDIPSVPEFRMISGLVAL